MSITTTVEKSCNENCETRSYGDDNGKDRTIGRPIRRCDWLVLVLALSLGEAVCKGINDGNLDVSPRELRVMSGLENFLDGEIWMVVVHRSTTFFSSEWPRPPLFSSDGLLKDFSSFLGKELVGATTEDFQRREKEGEGEV
ncbi:unnamed protein product [Linum tenue]|uniref:Uncharacterized protein n=1 Tax=Linum tenue TaxID=586396 RepID=A0AAV0H7U3_9ROSI|nr:unnamed protein product [Linum tenue]CAI0380588.1 unnamed protein product [Linum tenue]